MDEKDTKRTKDAKPPLRQLVLTLFQLINVILN